VFGGLAGSGRGRRGALTVVSAMAGSGAGCARGEAQGWPFIGRRVHEGERGAALKDGRGNHGAARDGRGAQGSPVGGAARGLTGSTGEHGCGFRDMS
jgi:hypothetical protein